MSGDRDIFGPKKGFLNSIKWALVCAKEDARFWVEIRLHKWAMKIITGSDGRPCHTDVFLVTLFLENDDHHGREAAINAWLEGNWAEACKGLSIKPKEPKQ